MTSQSTASNALLRDMVRHAKALLKVSNDRHKAGLLIAIQGWLKAQKQS